MDCLAHNLNLLTIMIATEESLEGAEPFGASMLVETKHPALVLEDIDSYLTSIQCSRSGISLGFQSSQQSIAAEKAWNTSDFLVFTSHRGCNKNGERQPYL